MGIPELFAGRSDGSEWRGVLVDQLSYAITKVRMLGYPYARDALCTRTRFCVLHWNHPGDCLAFMTLHNIPADPTLPPERRAPGTTS